MKNLRKDLRKVMTGFIVMILAVWAISVTAEANTAGYKFTYKKVTVSMHSKAKKLIKKAGKAEKIKVKKSCAYKGKDRTYKYESFILYTYSNSEEGEEYVNGITFLDDTMETPEGIKVGSSLSDVIEAYGKTEDKFGIYTYEKGLSRIQVEIEDDMVVNLRYVALLKK